jgi:protein-tyrosine kinase
MKNTFQDSMHQVIDQVSILDEHEYESDMYAANTAAKTAVHPSAQRPEPSTRLNTARLMGDILRESKKITAPQLERILALQRERKLKFGQAAMALGYVQDEDVMWALSQQFHYPYAPHAADQLKSELVVACQPFGKSAEAFRALRSQVLLRLHSGHDARRRALAVVSANRGDGKTYLAANLAAVLSQTGARTLLIDADMRQPRQHALFGLQSGNGHLPSDSFTQLVCVTSWGITAQPS